MSKKGIENHFYKHGLRSGYTDYRYGSDKEIGKKKHQQIYKGENRKHVIDLVMDGLRDWRSSCFENEAYIRTGLRSALCLKGHAWPDADAEAKSIVSTALTYLGYSRPPWIEGQPEFVIARENCLTCGLALPEALAVGGRESQFCSVSCARSYMKHRDSVTARTQGDSAFWGAESTIRRLGIQARECAHCGSKFHPLIESGKYCSHKCATSDRFITDQIECLACGKLFRAHLKDPNARRSYCSKACAYNHRKQIEIKRTCEFCAGSFVANTQKAKYCCNACCVMDNRMKKGYQPKWMTPTLFDHVFKEAA